MRYRWARHHPVGEQFHRRPTGGDDHERAEGLVTHEADRDLHAAVDHRLDTHDWPERLRHRGVRDAQRRLVGQSQCHPADIALMQCASSFQHHRIARRIGRRQRLVQRPGRAR